MFKKKPQIKNLSPLRSSDRRKLADQIISEFNVQIPSQEADSKPSEETPTEIPASTVPTLSSIRNNLLPENCLSARFTTHEGPDNKLVSGTVYVGAHAGDDERILWLQWGANSPRLYPTVYTLWANPGLVPLLHTPGLVIQKLKGGADLMTPGLFGGPPWPAGATKNAIVAVANLDRPSVPVWVGICEIDISSLGNVQGVKGKAVDGIHWAGDEIWSWSSSSTITTGRESPKYLKGWGDEVADDRLTKDAQNLDLNDEEDALSDADEGVSLAQSQKLMARDPPKEQRRDKSLGREADEDREPTTQEIDDAFQQAFLYAVYDAKKNGAPPFYGLDLPDIQASVMMTKLIQPYLRSHNPHYTIKKTSWKNAKKFIKHLDKQKIIKSKDRGGHETVIHDIDFDDEQVKQFTPYRLPKPKADDQNGSTVMDGAPPAGQNLGLQYLYRASSKLVPDLIPSKTDFYTRAEISSFIRTYIDNSTDASSPKTRFLKINPFIANNVLAPSLSTSDDQIIAKGEIGRDVLQKRVLDDPKLCIPFWILLGSDQQYDPANKSMPKPKSGPPPKVTITIEKRTGTKTVTRVAGLENFNVIPQTLVPDLKKACASSVGVEQVASSKMLEIQLQGDQRDAVIKEVGKRGIKKEWFEVIDKTKKKSGGGARS